MLHLVRYHTMPFAPKCLSIMFHAMSYFSWQVSFVYSLLSLVYKYKHLGWFIVLLYVRRASHRMSLYQMMLHHIAVCYRTLYVIAVQCGAILQSALSYDSVRNRHIYDITYDSMMWHTNVWDDQILQWHGWYRITPYSCCIAPYSIVPSYAIRHVIM